MDRTRQISLASKPAKRRASSNRGGASKLRNQDRATMLSIVLSGDEPPTEFRIFTAGTVETTKGSFTFDEAAAKSVMAEYALHGIDLMIDYDHASLASVSIDPALAGKAAGWFNLEVRNGELWAVNVRWTEPAADALRRKEWRFMSPAFGTTEGRVTDLLNVALTNIPATRKLEPLMAASATASGENAMTVEEFLKVCKALGIDMTMPLADAMAKIQGGDADASTEDAPPPVGDGGADEATETAGDAPPPPADDKKDKPAEVAAAASRLMRLSGAKTFVEAISMVETWRASHLELETERVKLAKEREVLEGAERRRLTVERVTLGGRKPAEVWADEKCSAPKGYFATMPIADYREMCADEVKANGGKVALRAPVRLVPGSTAAQSGAVDKHGLDAREQQICKDAGTDPAVFADLKARREAAKTAKS